MEGDWNALHGWMVLDVSGCGEVAEWPNAPDSKSGLRFYRNVGSTNSSGTNLDRRRRAPSASEA
jgi:hypothetical protein